MTDEYANPNDLVFYVKYHIKPEFINEFQERLMNVVENMTQEDSFVSAFVHQYAESEGRFSMYERWTDSSKDAFMTYQMEGKDYRKEYEKRLPLISETPRKIHLLKPLAYWISANVKPSENDLIFYVNFHIKPDKVEDWKKAALQVLNKMAEEDTFVSTFLHQDAEDPSRFTIYERWNEPSMEAFEKNHLNAKEYRQVYENMLPNLMQSMRTFRILEPLGSWIGK
ncbi:putative quinol monooxygenase [Marinifilum flexuosum]|uniref:Quinol monooxygenase YgiN n=1 Tax=Marinifilum flexuosum TaxID=1117708 RepID=A0A419XA14_9BACT|nr:antibiotic biosynthesis monooxygenase [Marinifilum flexuosum]RKE04399.1 quinol monooxygenase YgiN [Marinifilum flexuosum]